MGGGVAGGLGFCFFLFIYYFLYRFLYLSFFGLFLFLYDWYLFYFSPSPPFCFFFFWAPLFPSVCVIRDIVLEQFIHYRLVISNDHICILLIFSDIVLDALRFFKYLLMDISGDILWPFCDTQELVEAMCRNT